MLSMLSAIQAASRGGRRASHDGPARHMVSSSTSAPRLRVSRICASTTAGMEWNPATPRAGRTPSSAAPQDRRRCQRHDSSASLSSPATWTTGSASRKPGSGWAWHPGPLNCTSARAATSGGRCHDPHEPRGGDTPRNPPRAAPRGRARSRTPVPGPAGKMSPQSAADGVAAGIPTPETGATRVPVAPVRGRAHDRLRCLRPDPPRGQRGTRTRPGVSSAVRQAASGRVSPLIAAAMSEAAKKPPNTSTSAPLVKDLGLLTDITRTVIGSKALSAVSPDLVRSSARAFILPGAQDRHKGQR